MDFPTGLIENQIRRGTILHSNMFDDIDHGKFFVVIGVTEEYVAGFFFINSNINRSLYGKQEQFIMQYPMKRSDYGFLNYDSFLCATNIIKRNRCYIADSIKKGVTKFIGEMKECHLNEVLEMARKSKLFSKKEKEEFFY